MTTRVTKSLVVLDKAILLAVEHSPRYPRQLPEDVSIPYEDALCLSGFIEQQIKRLELDEKN